MADVRNADLAGVARRAADQSMRDRAAWLCVAVVLGETRTVTAARRALADVPIDAIRHRAGQLLDQLLDGD